MRYLFATDVIQRMKFSILSSSRKNEQSLYSVMLRDYTCAAIDGELPGANKILKTIKNTIYILSNLSKDQES